jgi:nucleoside-diphosphate-sugar epimerase
MLKVLIIGCGDLGGAVARQLLQLGIQATGVRRSDNTTEGVSLILADVTQTASLQVLVPLRPEILIYCVAANGQSDEQYKAHYVDGLRHVLAAQYGNSRLKQVFFVSSTRVYGQDTEDILDESNEAIPADFGGERLLEAENLLKDLSCDTTVLRLSGIYGAGRLRMINIAKSPEKWPLQNGWSNRIHRDDAAAFIVFLVQRVFAGEAIRTCYIVTDSRPASQYDVLNWIAARMHLNGAELVDTPIKGGKRLNNQAMLATGFILQYPDYQAGYGALLSSISGVQTEVSLA